MPGGFSPVPCRQRSVHAHLEQLNTLVVHVEVVNLIPTLVTVYMYMYMYIVCAHVLDSFSLELHECGRQFRVNSRPIHSNRRWTGNGTFPLLESLEETDDRSGNETQVNKLAVFPQSINCTQYRGHNNSSCIGMKEIKYTCTCTISPH